MRLRKPVPNLSLRLVPTEPLSTQQSEGKLRASLGTKAMPLEFPAEGATNFREGHLQLQGEYEAVLSVLLSEHSAGGRARRQSRARGGATVTTPLCEPCTWNLPPRRMTARSFRTAGSGKMPFSFQFSVSAVIIFSRPRAGAFPRDFVGQRQTSTSGF